MLTSNKQTLKGAQGGFTIVELVIAFLIIGILTAILVPTLSNRAADAKIAACEQDLNHLADAMERAAIDTGYLYRLYVLDDNGGDGDRYCATNYDNRGSDDGGDEESIVDNKETTNNIYTEATHIFISPAKQNFMETTQQDELFRRISGERGVRAESEFGWHGPYVNWKKDGNMNDWPDDPWGNDYLFFTRVGVIYPPLDGLDQNPPSDEADYSDQFYDKGPRTSINGSTVEFDAQFVFDRPTLLSLGPDGLPGDGTTGSGYGQGDDIIRSFGGVSY